MDDDTSLSGLLCLENETYLVDGDDDEENVQMLLDREMSFGFNKNGMSFGFNKNGSLVLSNGLKCARSEAITWILKTRAVFGFRFQTAYLSVIYFDRFLSKGLINSEKSWQMRLLSMACLSLAAKMEEIQVPTFSEFRNEAYNFESKVIQRMELLILSTLEWKMRSITPFAFLPYFITKMSKQSPQSHFMSTIVQLILAIMNEINLLEHRPSVIAAAATLRAMDERLTRKALECIMNSISYCRYLEIEEVITCYDLMQKMEMEKLHVPKSVISPDLSPTHLRAINVLDDSSSSAAVCSKRKRLTFNKSDNSPDIPKEKRLS